MMATVICNFPGITVKATGEMVEWASAYWIFLLEDDRWSLFPPF
jgi:hypothetical protein